MSTLERQSQLSDEQQATIDAVVKYKENVFITGNAGTGKSFITRHIIKLYKNILKGGELAITATTGRAAVNIEGTTLHSFAGLGLASESPTELLTRVQFNKKTLQRWKSTKVLLIDEVSMLDAEFFEKLNFVAKGILTQYKPFGGIQLILVGDLLQLPPVENNGNIRKRVIESSIWKECVTKSIVLTKVYRQSDQEFSNILNHIRLGYITDEVTQYIRLLERKVTYDSEVDVVNLYSTKAKADKFNSDNLNKIDGNVVEYVANDVLKQQQSATIFNNFPAVQHLQLKVGAQVMLVKNTNTKLVNGTVGTVVGFSKSRELTSGIMIESIPIVKFELLNGNVLTTPVPRQTWKQVSATGIEVASRTQIPLILAWAVTIHKSQGQTIERLCVDLSDIFEDGQVYTALSRAVSPNSLQVIGFEPNKVKVDSVSLKYYIDNNLI